MPSRTRHSISISLALAGEARRLEHAVAPAGSRAPALRARRARCSARRRGTRPAAPPTRAAAPSSASGVPGMFQAAAISVGATISSVALAPAATSAGTTAGGGVDVLEEAPARASCGGRSGTRLEHRLGDERERALGADQQPPEDLQRLVGVEERAQPVAGRVLDLELARDALAQLARRRAARRGSRSRPAASSGAAAAKRSLGVRRRRCRSRRRWRARTSSS